MGFLELTTPTLTTPVPGRTASHGEFFDKPCPARTTVSTGLGPGMKVEIDGIVVLSD